MADYGIYDDIYDYDCQDGEYDQVDYEAPHDARHQSMKHHVLPIGESSASIHDYNTQLLPDDSPQTPGTVVADEEWKPRVKKRRYKPDDPRRNLDPLIKDRSLKGTLSEFK